MKESSLLKPMRVRFTEPDDVRMYGDRWYVYDEAAIVRLPARELIRLETLLGGGGALVRAMNGMRADSVSGDLACSWLAVHLADPDVAGDFDMFAPSVMLLDWEPVPDDEAPEAVSAVPLDPTPTPDSPSGPEPAQP